MARLRLTGLTGIALCTALACSASGGNQNTVSTGGSSSGASGGSGNSGGSENGGNANGGSGNGGGNGGSAGIPLDGGGANGGGGGLDPDAACEAVSQKAEERFQPADIIWAIDTSGSMVEEANSVQQNINAFSSQIVASGVDVHVVMLAGYPFWPLPGICVPQPLGSGQCPADSKAPNFLHVQQSFIDSVDALRKLVARYNDYRLMLRPDSLKYVVVVTDDNSATSPDGSSTGDPGAYDNNPQQFVTDYSNLDPSLLKNPDGSPAWKFSAIYAFTQCANAARVGTVYKDVVNATGGIHGDICSCPPGQLAACQQTFQQIFNELATKISQGAVPLDCEWGIPPPPQGQSFDANRVNVEFTDQDNGSKETIYRVNDQASCDPTLGGWYYDDPNNPTRVIACPATCNKVKSVVQGQVDIAFGCESVVIPR
ncbi:MAG: VWA domain-containing protein [Myxococcales bacterium]|nr:VWA domain-containing protein [Myxococcales bacterium]